ncbi:MAG: hypothetical protein M9962_14860 [Oligoflexia bacterium]|nr:hypothetical protein [Oligoflexia bacterium]
MDIWYKMKKTILLVLVVFLCVGSGFFAYTSSIKAAAIYGLSICCFVLGFLITETLSALFSKVKKANFSFYIMILVAKFAWWGFIFWLSSVLPKELQIPFVAGIGAFLLSLLVGALFQLGRPKIFDNIPSGDS